MDSIPRKNDPADERVEREAAEPDREGREGKATPPKDETRPRSRLTFQRAWGHLSSSDYHGSGVVRGTEFRAAAPTESSDLLQSGEGLDLATRVIP